MEARIKELAKWLRDHSRSMAVPGGMAIAREFEAFRTILPEILGARQLQEQDLIFGDYTAIVSAYLIETGLVEPAAEPETTPRTPKKRKMNSRSS